ncbi:hypothetical protein NPIL_98511 [Nephila pilipes]|uniref:Uncharacterized protein n=1 Tax=Nephila pilipes TaxID=299642 RepID=A0A8X6P7W5_NEPPI|nr:hypothetical protein NPIL_98511 [Nephila pilipes]
MHYFHTHSSTIPLWRRRGLAPPRLAREQLRIPKREQTHSRTKVRNHLEVEIEVGRNQAHCAHFREKDKLRLDFKSTYSVGLRLSKWIFASSFEASETLSKDKIFCICGYFWEVFRIEGYLYE